MPLLLVLAWTGVAAQESGSDAALVARARGIHERVDGSGYPDGLRGAEIPLPARIIGACVAFVELTRGAERRSAGDAVEELRADAGAAFDPDVVEALAAVEDVAAAVPAAAA